MTEILSPLTQSLATPARTGYLPIEDHGVIGDLRSVALVGTDGTIDWYCPGRFDTPSVFAALLDQGRGGYFQIAPAGEGWKSRQLYFPDTNVLITRFSSHEGVAEVIDFMPVMKTGDGGRHRLVRTVLGIRGELTLRAEVDPRFDYGRQPSEAHAAEDGFVFRSSAGSLALSTRAPLAVDGSRAVGEFTIAPDERLTFVLENDDAAIRPRPYTEEEARALFIETVEFWRRWLRQCRYVGRWREVVHRSALALKLLTYQPTGAIVAAANDEPARAARRRAQLGLPLHVDSRRVLLPLRPPPPRLHRGSGRVRQLARRPLPRAHGQRVGPASDHVRDRRQPRPRGDHPRSLRGLPRIRTCAGRQRSRRPAAARHLRRAHRLHLPLQQVRRAHLLRRVEGPHAHRRLGGRELGPSGRRSMGDARRAPALHLLPPDVLGRGRARGQDRAPARTSGATSSAGCAYATRSSSR